MVNNNLVGADDNAAYLQKIEGLVKDIVTQNNISYYRIESGMEQRVNTQNEKVFVPVIKIISYFENLAVPITELLVNEFDVKAIAGAGSNNSWVDSFVAQNSQFSVGLKANRLGLTEYKKWGAKRFEVQLSSILQDAWKGMEQELAGGNAVIPDSVKRDFYRVGALLEMADLEFAKIKKSVSGNAAVSTAVMPALPVAEEVYVQPAATAAPVPTVIPPAAEPMQPAVIASSEPLEMISEGSISNLSSMDMTVDSLKGLDMNVSNVENRNGISEEGLTNIINGEHKTENTPAASGGANAETGGVALNIDNIENFNMNVSGMIIEKAAEAAALHEGGEKNIATILEDKDKAKAEPAPVDENSQMTDLSLKEYVQNSKLLKEVDALIAERAGAKLNEDIDIEGDVERLRFLKVFSLKQLHERITDNKLDIVAFAEKWIGKDNGGTFDSGICLFYLEYLLVGKKNDPAFAVEYVLKFISDNDYSARYIIPTYNSIKTSGEPSNFAHLTLK